MPEFMDLITFSVNFFVENMIIFDSELTTNNFFDMLQYEKSEHRSN